MISEIYTTCECGHKIKVNGYWYNQICIESYFYLKKMLHYLKHGGKIKMKVVLSFLESMFLQILLIPIEFISYFY